MRSITQSSNLRVGPHGLTATEAAGPIAIPWHKSAPRASPRPHLFLLPDCHPRRTPLKHGALKTQEAEQVYPRPAKGDAPAQESFPEGACGVAPALCRVDPRSSFAEFSGLRFDNDFERRTTMRAHRRPRLKHDCFRGWGLGDDGCLCLHLCLRFGAAGSARRCRT